MTGHDGEATTLPPTPSTGNRLAAFLLGRAEGARPIQWERALLCDSRMRRMKWSGSSQRPPA